MPSPARRWRVDGARASRGLAWLAIALGVAFVAPMFRSTAARQPPPMQVVCTSEGLVRLVMLDGDTGGAVSAPAREPSAISGRELAAFLAAISLASPGFAGTPPAAPVPSSTATPLSASAGLASGEVRKVDRESKRLTLDHGPLANLNMVAMTMAFRVKDDAMLERVKVGDKVRFHVEKIDGRYIVTHLEPASP